MTTGSETPNVDNVPPRLDSPGTLLNQAREQAKISALDLASRLRLSRSIIYKLEADDFDNLPAPTYITGYIRLIAKELNIAAEPILFSYANFAAVKTPPLSDFATRAPMQFTTSHRSIKSITYLLCAGLAILVGAWWQAQYSDRSMATTSREGQLSDGVDTTATPFDYTYTIVQHPEIAIFQASAYAATGDEDVDQEPPIGAQGDIEILATAEAWIEITDNQHARLYYNLARPGERISLFGQAPYQLVIGNAPSVTLVYRGETVDLAAVTFKGVARLSLGQTDN